ncbi:MAG TPA: GNAT family N-acetyltransferase [Pyrinomonadaceae bacterium]|nr:GNAT family N-acetyltransferase [Pyrinomonadaceae bacterium]
MKIKKQEHNKKGAFYIEEDGEWIAEMTYYKEGMRKLVIDHTEVSEKLKGKGIATKMVQAAVRYARERNLLIKPVCPFAKKVLESSEEYEDVLTR